MQEDIGLAIFIFGLCFPLLLSSEEAKDNDEKIMKKISLSKLSFEIDEENLTEDEIYIVSELIKPRKDNMEKIKRLARFITLKQSERDGYRFNFEIEDNDDRIEIITNFMMESDDLNKIIALEYIDEENLNKFWNTSRCTELHKSIMKNYYKAYESQKRVDPKIILVIQNHIKNDYKLAPILLETLKRFEDSGVNLYRIDESNLDKSKHKSSIIIESKNKHRIFSTQGYKYNSRGRDLEGFYLDLVPRKDDCREFEDQFNAIIRNTSCEIVNKDIIKEFETDLNIMNEALQKKKNKAE